MCERLDSRASVLMSLRVLWTVGFVLCLTGLKLIQAGDHPSYVAAVYEHRVLLNPEPRVPLARTSALKHMEQNLRVFDEQTAAAARQVNTYRVLIM